MEEVRGAGGPWTVAGGDPQKGGEERVLVVKCEGGWCWQNRYKWTDGKTNEEKVWKYSYLKTW